MLKRTLSLLAVVLAGCTQPAPVVSPSVPRSTQTPIPALSTPDLPVLASSPSPSLSTPVATTTARYTRTPKPTSTTTPTPTTFDPNRVITRTPASAERCPIPERKESVDIDFFDFSLAEGLTEKIMHAEENTLNFLNTYGADRLVAELKQSGRGSAVPLGNGNLKPSWVYKDLTNDGVAEFVFVAIDVYVMGCRNGTYETLLRVHPDWNGSELIEIADSRDLNLDGVPELVVVVYGGWHIDVYIHEWNGQSFDLLGSNDELSYLYMQGGVMSGPTEFEMADLDGNGTVEIVLRGGIPTNFDRINYGPWRVQTDTYAWDGTKYALAEKSFTAPEYRFQAVQDGDRAMLAGRYDEALVLYQTAIFSDTLEWWSPERSTYTAAKNEAEFQGQALPTPPATNSAEYEQLAAYSRYRILLLHELRGSLNEARIVYDTLLAKFAAGTPGHPYAELATVFWNEYQLSQSLRAACEKAIAYANAHPELLTPLGSSYHGWQSINYKPTDVCPAP